jgi:hypothetical protein
MTKRDYTENSGNVFADLGDPRAEEALAKAELAQKIIDAIRAGHLTQVQAAEISAERPGPRVRRMQADSGERREATAPTAGPAPWKRHDPLDGLLCRPSGGLRKTGRSHGFGRRTARLCPAGRHHSVPARSRWPGCRTPGRRVVPVPRTWAPAGLTPVAGPGRFPDARRRCHKEQFLRDCAGDM